MKQQQLIFVAQQRAVIILALESIQIGREKEVIEQQHEVVFYLCRHTQTLLDSIKCSPSRLFALPALRGISWSTGRFQCLHPDLKNGSQSFPVNSLCTPLQWNNCRNVSSRCLCLTCVKGRRLLGTAQGGTSNQCSHEKMPISNTTVVVPACTPGFCKSLFTLVKNSVFFSLGFIEIQGLDRESPFSPCIN